MAMLTIFIARKKAAMETAGFPQLPEEDLSERNVHLIIFAYLPLLTVVLPSIQVGLAYTYFKHFHIWARY